MVGDGIFRNDCGVKGIRVRTTNPDKSPWNGLVIALHRSSIIEVYANLALDLATAFIAHRDGLERRIGGSWPR